MDLDAPAIVRASAMARLRYRYKAVKGGTYEAGDGLGASCAVSRSSLNKSWSGKLVNCELRIGRERRIVGT